MTAAANTQITRSEIIGVLDMSNVFHCAGSVCQSREGTWASRAMRLDFEHLAQLILVGRTGRIFAACGGSGGRPGLVREARHAGIDLHVLELGAETGREVAVDEAIQAYSRGRLLATPPEQPLVLATGDGKPSQTGDGFTEDVKAAISQKRPVELLAFKYGLSNQLRELVEQYDLGRFVDLTRHYAALTTIPGQRRSDHLNLARRPVAPRSAAAAA